MPHHCTFAPLHRRVFEINEIEYRVRTILMIQMTARQTVFEVIHCRITPLVNCVVGHAGHAAFEETKSGDTDARPRH